MEDAKRTNAFDRRSLQRRLASAAAILACVAVAVLYLPVALGCAVLAGVSVAAQIEFYRMLSLIGIPAFPVVGALCGAGLIAVTTAAGAGGGAGASPGAALEVSVLPLIVMALMVRLFPQRYNPRPIATVGGTLLGIVYIPCLMDYFMRLALVSGEAGLWHRVPRTGVDLVFYVIITVKCADAAAYFVGTRFGRRKLFKRLSPGKTWEGSAAGLLGGAAAGCLYLWLRGWAFGCVPVHPGHAVAMGLLLTAVGAVGDLSESQIKRAVSAKDSGTAIPGMGGILDVIDSLLFAAPVLYLYVRLFLLRGQ